MMTLRERLTRLAEAHAINVLPMAEHVRATSRCFCALLKERDVHPCLHCRCSAFLTESFKLLEVNHREIESKRGSRDG